MKVLIVDDEKNIQKILSDIITDNEWKPFVAGTTEEAEDILKREFIDVLLLDVFLEREREGLDFLQKIRTDYDFPPEVVIITGHGTIDMAIEAVKMGAYDLIEKPPSIERLTFAIKRAYEHIKNTRKRLYIKEDETPIIGNSARLKKVMGIVKSVAPTDGSVLITGESGVGKELIAKSIHLNSKRKDGPFIIVNSAAIPADLVESELFGYEKGAFTNALKMKRGRFELADGGTLFLDEIGDMSLKTQSKILRALQDKKIERVGGEGTIKVDVRIIAATNKDIEKMTKEGKFREDLYYRLNVVRIHIDPLKERKEDIKPLFNYYVNKFSQDYGRMVKKIDNDVYKYILNEEWKGNIRELKNFAEKAVIFSKNDEISLSQLGLKFESLKEKFGSFSLAKKEFEKNYLEKALAANNFNISQTAKMLIMDKGNLFKKIKSLGIKIEDSKDSN